MFTRILRITVLSLLCLLPSASALQAAVQTTRVFAHGEDGCQYYRVPALCNTANGNLIAIADRRGDSPAGITPNPGKIQLVAKISRDNGATWGEMRTLFPDFTLSHGDAAVCLYPPTGDLVVVFSAGQSYACTDEAVQTYVATSQDNGETWSTPMRIDPQIRQQIDAAYEEAGSPRRYFTGFAASGNMLVTENGIAFVATVRHTDEKDRPDIGYEYVVALTHENYANMRWQVLNPATPLCDDGSGNQSKMADLGGQDCIMSIRTAGQHRFAYSHDRGATWEEPFTAAAGPGLDELYGPGCNGGFVRHSGGDADRLMLALPADANARRNVSIFYSEDRGISWRRGLELIFGPSGYSALRVLGNGNIGALVESGDDTNGYDIQFFNVPVNDIISQGPHETYTGTLSCNGLGYLEIPNDYQTDDETDDEKDSPFSMTDLNRGITLTCRVFTTQFSNKRRGIFTSLWHGENESTLLYKGTSGFVIYGGAKKNESLGNTVTLDNNLSNPLISLDSKPVAEVISVGKLHHIALVIAAGTDGRPLATLYVNGGEVTRGVIGNHSESYATPYQMSMRYNMLIGTEYDLTRSGYNNRYYCAPHDDGIWIGDIDDVRYYNRALTPDEVAKDRDWGFPILTAAEGLVAAYDFAAETADGNGYTDISGHGHDARKCHAEAAAYDFPPLDPAEVTVRPMGNPDYGVLTISHFVRGYPELVFSQDDGPTDDFTSPLNKDFYATARPFPGYELVGIYVNGFALPIERIDDKGTWGAFFKANARDLTVLAKYREADVPMTFYLMGDEINTTPFVPTGDGITYTLLYHGVVTGNFHVEEGVPTETATYSDSFNAEFDRAIHLYANPIHRVNGGDTFVAMEGNTPYNVVNPGWINYTPIHLRLDTDKSPGISWWPMYTLVYNPLGGVRTLTVNYSEITGIEEASADPTAPEYYTLTGVHLAGRPSVPGLYIVRRGRGASKILIR